LPIAPIRRIRQPPNGDVCPLPSPRSRTIPIESLDLASTAFLFDVDGTLIDIAPTPRSVQVPDSLRLNLRQLARLTSGATALVSGRSLHNLDGLFGPLGLTLVGGHGAEFRLWHGGRPEETQTPALPEWVRQRCNEIAAKNENIFLENKGYSIAIHYRLAPSWEEPIREAVDAMLASEHAAGLEALHGKAVVEIKRAELSKGSAIRTLMTHAPFAGRRPVFVGDDITDEAAFAAMPEFDGMALSVGRTVAGAVRRFETPADVRDWVEQICRTGDLPK
jgi:trehalose 6-phosphate phosphatase